MGYTNIGLIESELNLASGTICSSSIPSVATVEMWIQEAEAEIDALTNRYYAQKTVTNKLMDYNGKLLFRLPNTPVISITKIEYNMNSIDMASSWVTLQEGNGYNYVTYLTQGEVQFTPGTLASYRNGILPGTQRLRLSYVYGYQTVPINVQRLATLLVTKRMISANANSDAYSSDGTLEIAGFIKVAEVSSFNINRINAMNQDIDYLRKEVLGKMKVFKTTRVYAPRNVDWTWGGSVGGGY